MQFNKVKRGAKRERNNESDLFEILDAGFLVHVAFTFEGQAMIIPTTYGRDNDCIYLHGSKHNFMFSQITNGQQICLSMTLLDGLVYAQSLFHSSANYRSIVIFGKAEEIIDSTEHENALWCIGRHIMKSRVNEVPLGSQHEIQSTKVIKVKIDRASVKIRDEGPVNDDPYVAGVWSGHVPLKLVAGTPIPDAQIPKKTALNESIIQCLKDYSK